MKFSEAAAFKIQFGTNAGKTIDEVAKTDAGLRYLDWLRGHRRSDDALANKTGLDGALVAYLDDPAIAADLAKLTGRGAQ